MMLFIEGMGSGDRNPYQDMLWTQKHGYGLLCHMSESCSKRKLVSITEEGKTENTDRIFMYAVCEN